MKEPQRWCIEVKKSLCVRGGGCRRHSTYAILAYTSIRRNLNFEFYYVCIDTKRKNIELVVTFYVYAHMHKEITFYVFFGEKREPSEIYANSNLRNLTHITQKPSYVYTFFTYTLKEITAQVSYLR